MDQFKHLSPEKSRMIKNNPTELQNSKECLTI